MHRARSSWAGVVGLGLALTGAGAVEAQVEVTGNVAIASDYAFRGISQTLEKAAVQGGLDAAGPRGMYVGAWGSSVNFGEDLAAGGRAQMELDVYAGFAPTAGGFDLDLGALYYAYPGAATARAYDFLEVYAGLGRQVGPLNAELNAAYSPDYFGGSGTGIWTGGSLTGGLPSLPATFELSLGRQSIEDNDAWGTPNYTAWRAGLGTDLLGATLGAALTGTSLGRADCFGGTDLCGTRLIVSVARGI
jgi:uncharacterized protein (TIGR02001 family)